MSRTRQVATGLAVLWLLFVGYLGLTDRRGIIGLPDSLAEPTQHFVSFAVLAALLAIAFPSRWWRIGLTLATIGIAGEVLQLATEDRQFDAVDIGMNLAGIAVGLGVMALTSKSFTTKALPKSVAGAVFSVTIALLLAGPFVLPVQKLPETSFPSECVAAPSPVGGEPVMLFDGLSGSDDSAIDDVSVRQIKDAVIQTTEFAVEAWFDTPDLQQTGPARVFTISEGTNVDQMNFHLGVEGSTLSVRFRTSCELFNWVQIKDVIKVGQLQHIVVNWSGGVLETWVDGAVADRTELLWGDFTSWGGDFAISIGDEVGGDRAFDGNVSSVTMWDRALGAPATAERNTAGP